MSKPSAPGRLHLLVDDPKVIAHYGKPVTWCGHTRLLRTTKLPIAADCKVCLKSYDAKHNRTVMARAMKKQAQGVTGIDDPDS